MASKERAGSGRSATSKSRRSAGNDSSIECPMGNWTLPQSLTTLSTFLETAGLGRKWSQGASPAKTSRLPEKEPDLKGLARAYGVSSLKSFAMYTRDSSLWKTYPPSQGEGLTESSVVWPVAGTMRNGIVYRLPPWVLPKGGRDSGLWPTPKASPSGPDYARMRRPKSGGDDLATAVARITPGPLNPEWVEWLMGFSLGWTDSAPSETPLFPKLSSGSGEGS